MKRFKTTVTRTDEYIIEIDENVIDEEWMKNFVQYFDDFDTYKEHAEYLAQHRARFQHDFIEGYGLVKVNGEIPKFVHGHPNEGINIIIESEDYDCEIEVEEIE